ncbi:dihydroxyacetone kinase 2 [Capsaspora owczarzaki ATCC 30864]|uniref:Dihydroxyacetone kinase 2 n=1 Tax=Capsaspora owczarzaki (strain ATCC 30864) TaxID=595528 RepID=A0A0D2VVH0_CAPO3|nr:dihydroxyacetone kinase 2 [Capsaspora owczarzaki ATCC 30864]KJE95482.1 dihydroxyacetone kinase 2 [Capsaspora owczarzaki ATCC 30864]|eukprot:XP_004345521.1 dihydroxyacetone kinase 2 [Capsaspora owczarzaki ATCC 30864]
MTGQRVLRIALEGNISAGKSTFLDILSQELDIVIVPEPVSRWQQVDEIRNDPRSAAAFREMAIFQGEAGSEPEHQDGDSHAHPAAFARGTTPSIFELENSNTFDSIPASQDTGGNLLSLFYNSPNRWSFTFQIYACLSRIRAQQRPPENPHPKTLFIGRKNSNSQSQSESPTSDVIEKDSTPAILDRGLKRSASEDQDPATTSSSTEVSTVESGNTRAQARPRLASVSEIPPTSIHFTERSVFSDRYCFALNCVETGLMTRPEFFIYQEWHSFMEASVPEAMKLDGIVYLRSTPEVCHERLQRRAREEESAVSVDYLHQLHQRHEDWLIRKKESLKVSPLASSCPLLIVDSDKEFQHDPVRCKEMVEQVKQFMLDCRAQFEARK